MLLQKINLSQGQVSYRLIGEGRRKIIFYHGFPGSSSQVALFKTSVEQLDIQVLCFDRPGYNETLWSTNNMLDQTVKISDEITRTFDWKEFEIVTVSGGTPYGIAFANRHPKEISGVRVVCGLGYLQSPEIKKHFKKMQFFSLNYLKFIPGAFLKQILNRPKSPQLRRNPVFELFYPTSASDRQVIQQRSLSDALNNTLIEAVAQNAAGPIADSQVFLSSWGEVLKDFKLPIHFWHGDQDLVIPFQVSKEMAKLIPQAEFTLVPNEGHVSLAVNKMLEILSVSLKK